ncbi:peripherin isoform X2 [Serinus canaria]|uniref:Peripherin n=1 Tax=Serinus canaria TaxID=9135 RepID=A0A8C9NIE8_SERCA|nr:peripherin isoform X2 [Serinus canaria]
MRDELQWERGVCRGELCRGWRLGNVPERDWHEECDGMRLCPRMGVEDAAGWGWGSPREGGFGTGECPGKGRGQQTLGKAPWTHGGHWEALGDVGSAEGRGPGRGRTRVGTLGGDCCERWGPLHPRWPPLCAQQEEGVCTPAPTSLSSFAVPRLEDETQKREDAEKSLVLFRKDVDHATLSRLELERKVELLMDEIGFLKKLHEEELRDLEVSGPSPAGLAEVEVCKPELTAALREIRTQYESIAVKNLQEAEEWYKSKFADLSDAANRNHEALRLAKQEMNESRRQIQSLTCEVDGLKGVNEALQRQMREMEDEFGEEIGNYQDVVGRLEQEIQQMKEEMARHLREYQDLLNVKMALDIEIATYRKLLEGEESRITIPPHPTTSFSMRSSVLEPQPAESPARRMVLIKTIETRDGQQVVTESHKERAGK